MFNNSSLQPFAKHRFLFPKVRSEYVNLIRAMAPQNASRSTYKDSRSGSTNCRTVTNVDTPTSLFDGRVFTHI